MLRFGTLALMAGTPLPASSAEPAWMAAHDVGDFALLGDEVIAVNGYLRALDVGTGQERRSVRLRKASDAHGPEMVVATESAIAFGWYVWYEDVYIVCADPSSLNVRWVRRVKIPEREREGLPSVTPVVRPDAVFVLISDKYSDNLFRLRPDNGDIVWSRYVERIGLRTALVWHGNHLLVRSRVTRGAQAAGDLHAIDPMTGATLWKVHLDGQQELGAEAMLVADNRAYVAARMPPGDACKLHVVDLSAGALIKSHTIASLADPFAYHDGILYFGGNMPTAWDVNREEVVWRTDLRQRGNVLLSIAHDPVLDVARRKIYVGESKRSFYVLSSTDGTVLGSVDVRRGRTSPRMMAVFGAFRMRLIRDLLLVATGDSRLLAFSAASL